MNDLSKWIAKNWKILLAIIIVLYLLSRIQT